MAESVIIINPGTGPVDDATSVNAKIALGFFVADIRERGHEVTWDGLVIADDGSRWDAKVTVDGEDHEVSMPGCDPEVTRRSEPWVSPRLYVDGSSWLWQYALGACEPDPDADA